MRTFDVCILDGFGMNHKMYESETLEELVDYLKDFWWFEYVVAIVDKTNGNEYV